MDVIFDPEYGIYTYYPNYLGMFEMNSGKYNILSDPDSRLCWFCIDNTRDIETVEEFRMLGMIKSYI